MFFRDCSTFGKWINGELQRKYPQYFTGEKERGSNKVKKKKQQTPSLRKALKDLDKYWNTLLWNMADGNQSDIKELNKLEIFDFYGRLETFEDSIDSKKKAFDKQRAKLKK